MPIETTVTMNYAFGLACTTAGVYVIRLTKMVRRIGKPKKHLSLCYTCVSGLRGTALESICQQGLHVNNAHIHKLLLVETVEG